MGEAVTSLRVDPEVGKWGIRQGAVTGGCLQGHVDLLLRAEEKLSLSIALLLHSLSSLRI